MIFHHAVPDAPGFSAARLSDYVTLEGSRRKRNLENFFCFT